jgi:hypothetical protein
VLRSCLFCTDKSSTKEDVWPLWLMKRFPLRGEGRMFAERGGAELGDWPLSKARLTVRCLCKSCNNGWMSQLESETKPVVESILDGVVSALDTSAQSTLGGWAVKTAMVLEATDPNRPWFYSNDERYRLRTMRSVPQRTSVWIAKCVNQGDIYSAAKDHRRNPGDNSIRAFSVTMAFGSLAFQVVTVKASAAIPPNVAVTYDVSEGPWDATLVQVWPTSQSPRVWPPTYGLDSDRGLEALTERLNPNGIAH